MAQRLDLHQTLISILGVNRVYFQPPKSVQMIYPAIVYNLDTVETDFADDNPYNRRKRYLITVIDRNPDSPIPDKVGKLPMSVFDRFYTADDLNHFVYRVFL